jgi:hypothetical protein
MSRSQRSIVPAFAPAAPIFHAAASQRLAQTQSSVSPSPASSSRSRKPSVQRTQVYPGGEFGVVGPGFEVDFHRITRREGRFSADRLGYRVRHKGYLNGKRETAPIWRYGLELEYEEDDGAVTKLWLCKLCHLGRVHADAKIVNGTAHIAEHLRTVHRIDPASGLMPEDAPKPSFSSPFEAAKAAGSGTIVSHTPWQEEALQSALIDWVIVRDISFSDATSPATRGLLTWNRSSLLAALPNSKSTIASYVHKKLEQRKDEVGQLLRASPGRISISVDVWTSPNYMSFLGVVAHFAGTLPGSTSA